MWFDVHKAVLAVVELLDALPHQGSFRPVFWFANRLHRMSASLG